MVEISITVIDVSQLTDIVVGPDPVVLQYPEDGVITVQPMYGQRTVYGVDADCGPVKGEYSSFSNADLSIAPGGTFGLYGFAPATYLEKCSVPGGPTSRGVTVTSEVLE